LPSDPEQEMTFSRAQTRAPGDQPQLQSGEPTQQCNRSSCVVKQFHAPCSEMFGKAAHEPERTADAGRPPGLGKRAHRASAAAIWPVIHPRAMLNTANRKDSRTALETIITCFWKGSAACLGKPSASSVGHTPAKRIAAASRPTCAS